ncbi:MAG: heat-inducible transcriptional repressor HrcA [Lachnospirales bacterium]
MDLSERKLKILEAIVKDYITNGEPVGSRTIARDYDLGVSPATIRNEMSDLECMGLIVQRHKSSGRVPSDQGYRLYVNNILSSASTSKNKNIEFLGDIISSNINRIEDLMEETAKAIALLTNYVTIVTEPTKEMENATFKHLQLVPIDERSVLLVLVLNSNTVKNIAINLEEDNKYNYTYDYLLNLTEVLNLKLIGKRVKDVNKALVKEITDLMNGDNSLVDLVMKAISHMNFESNKRIHASGVNNLFNYPEFSSNMEKAKEVFRAIEEKEVLSKLITSDKEKNFEIIIGSENSNNEMKEFSIIKARYELGDNNYGNIGIIGPKRMNYEETIKVLNFMVDNINMAIKGSNKLNSS